MSKIVFGGCCLGAGLDLDSCKFWQICRTADSLADKLHPQSNNRTTTEASDIITTDIIEQEHERGYVDCTEYCSYLDADLLPRELNKDGSRVQDSPFAAE